MKLVDIMMYDPLTLKLEIPRFIFIKYDSKSQLRRKTMYIITP